MHLNQTRHTQLINEVRSCGARIKLIDEGEVSGCLASITGEKADIYIGYGYAPEAVLVERDQLPWRILRG